jgi:uncharacterized protein (DUF433 family)
METSLAHRIVTDPAICGGKPTVRGSRLLVKTVLDYLAAGDNAEEIISYYDWLTPDDIRACLAYAADVLDHGRVFRQAA